MVTKKIAQGAQKSIPTQDCGISPNFEIVTKECSLQISDSEVGGSAVSSNNI